MGAFTVWDYDISPLIESFGFFLNVFFFLLNDDKILVFVTVYFEVIYYSYYKLLSS